MALNQAGMGYIFTARDQATGVINRVGGAFDRQATRARLSSGVMQAAALGVGASVATMATGVGTLRGAFDLAEASSEFGQTMARVGALSQAGASDMRALRDRAIEAGIATQFSPTEAAQGLSELAVRGFDAQQSMQALGGALDLAAGGNIDVGLAAQSVGAALRVFGLQADQAGYATDRLLRIANVTALQHNELALALGTVSRGAAATGQSLEEMLPAIGLVRNTGVEASVAASSVSSALIFMARNSDQIRQRLGVNVTDAQGNFRDFLDVVQEAGTALGERFPNEAERAAVASELFGRFGLTAVTGITQQLSAGMRNARGEIVRGSDAIEHLRNTMRTADGAAEEFRRRMLDTFRGQRVLLQGTLQTLQVVLGEAFARAFRPFVAALTNLLNFFIRVFNAIPEEVGTAVAGIVLAIGALVTALGGLGIIGFSVALIIPFLKIMAITMGVILLATLPVVAAVAVLASGFIALGLAIRYNLGGIGDWLRNVFARVSLGFRALRELLTRGGFSKAVAGELGLAQNQGIRPFIVNLFALYARARRFFSGIQKGFNQAFAAGAPAARALVRALEQLGRQLGFIGEATEAGASTPMQRFMEVGMQVGRVVGRAIVIIIDGIRNVVQFAQGMVSQFQEWLPTLRLVWDALSSSVGRLVDALRKAFNMQETAAGQGREGMSVFRELGRVFVDLLVPALIFVASYIGVVIEVLAALVRAYTWTVDTISAGFSAVEGWVNRQVEAWYRFQDAVLGVAENVSRAILRMMQIVPAPVRQALGWGGAEQTMTSFVGGREQQRAALAQAEQLKAARRTGGAVPVAAQPAVGAAGEAAGGRMAEAARMAGGDREALRQAVGAMRLAAAQPIVVQVDGEAIARATRGGARTAAAGEFAPVGVED